jgi:DNA-binding winged helix-turn-helix (wHTH) protein
LGDVLVIKSEMQDVLKTVNKKGYRFRQPLIFLQCAKT